jgi:hypothetical protein
MLDPELIADLRRLLNAFKRPEYVNDLVRNVDTDQVRAIVADNRHPIHPAQDPSAKVVPQGAGRVIDGNDTPVASTGTGGWVTPPQVDSWRPPGLREMDAMMDQADREDRAKRIRELAGTQHALNLAKAAAEAECKDREAGAKEKPGNKGERK